MKRLKKFLPVLAVVVVLIGFVNFFWFVAESQQLGGDALNGYQKAGHYYVSAHGEYTQVDAATWYRSRVHATSVFIAHPLALLAMAYLLFAFIFPAFMSRAGATSDPLALDRIRGSGTPIASASCGGRVGTVNFSGPLLSVTVYPRGFLLAPLFMKPLAVSSEAVTAMRQTKTLFTSGIEIAHESTQVASPITLWCGRDSSVISAIESITGKTVRT